MAKGVNTVRKQGPPSNHIASPITTGFSPAQNGTLDDYRDGVADGRPADPLGLTPGASNDSKSSRKTRRVAQ